MPELIRRDLGFITIIYYHGTQYKHTPKLPAAKAEQPMDWQHGDMDDIMNFLRAEIAAGRYHPVLSL